MTLSDDIIKAKSRLDQAVRHLLGSPDIFNSVSYNGMYKGCKINHKYSKFLRKAKERVAISKKKLEALERKFYRKKK